MSERTVCTASVWPHKHTDDLYGPVDVKIGIRSQPPIVRDWPKKEPVWIRLDQPDERTNLTILKLSFCPGREIEGDWYRINQLRLKKDNRLKFYVKSRITNRMEHPTPRGRWEGTCEYTDTWCLFTFQAITMKVQATQPRVILPDGSLPTDRTRFIVPGVHWNDSHL